MSLSTVEYPVKADYTYEDLRDHTHKMHQLDTATNPEQANAGHHTMNASIDEPRDTSES